MTPDEREARYAEAINDQWWTGSGDYRERAARAVVALADQEVSEATAGLRAEVERLRQQWADEAADACEARARTEAAESERDAARAEAHAAQERLRAVEALAVRPSRSVLDAAMTAASRPGEHSQQCPVWTKRGGGNFGPLAECNCWEGQAAFARARAVLRAALASPVESDAEAGAADTQGEGEGERAPMECGSDGGFGIGAGHRCVCNRRAGHALEESEAWHGCECGALWECSDCANADMSGCAECGAMPWIGHTSTAGSNGDATPETAADREGGEGR